MDKKALLDINDAICKHINKIEINERGELSQDIVLRLRHFVEHIMLIICEQYEENGKLNLTYENIKKVKQRIKTIAKYKFIVDFYKMLQIVVSHYHPSEENSERLMLKYYEYLFKIREIMKKDYNLNLLNNLEKFPLNLDFELKGYYQKIANKIDEESSNFPDKKEKFYIHKIKPFFMNNSIYYEVTISIANDYSNKTNRIIAFTKIPIESNYASDISFINSNIEILEHKMPILIITECKISIRECEFNNFIKIIAKEQIKCGYKERMAICSFMTESKFNLLDIVELPDLEYSSFKKMIKTKVEIINFLNILDICRDIINEGKKGKNIIKYLLFTMNNNIIKNQYTTIQNENISNLYLKNGVIPFDNMPFTFSLVKHNPPFNILNRCFEINEHKADMLARYVKNNTEYNGNLFTNIKDINEQDEEIEKLVNEYNQKLWYGHRPSNELVIDKKRIFIQGYVEDCRFIINSLEELSKRGIPNYSEKVDLWMSKKNSELDCEEKKEIIQKMFIESEVAILYGAAGTGKTTLINHVSDLFCNESKLFLAQTNTAVDNLKRKINVSNSDFMTINKFISSLKSNIQSDILIIDECSIVSNLDMKKILEKESFKYLILVGDISQIESIRFGNWFSLAKKYLKKSIMELKKTYRTNDEQLLKLWDSVRKMEFNNILELLTRKNYSMRFDTSIFERNVKDEIVLCLNYEGLYGINNINRFLQESNPNKEISWGVQTFKVGDPILFHDTNRFSSIIYNNMKGRILNISTFLTEFGEERIEFDIELDRNINDKELYPWEELQILKPEIYSETKNTVIRFSVYKNYNLDTDKLDFATIIPFQVSYAISIHKAQGLEYDSVKIVITNEIDEMITHNVFYTAITRTKSNLKIYWSPEVENKILSNIKPINNYKDADLLYEVKLNDLK